MKDSLGVTDYVTLMTQQSDLICRMTRTDSGQFKESSFLSLVDRPVLPDYWISRNKGKLTRKLDNL